MAWRYRLQGAAAMFVVVFIATVVYYWVGTGWWTYTGWRPKIFDRPAPPRVHLTKPRDDIPGLTNFAQVSRNLYRGAAATGKGYRALQLMGVRTVVDLREWHSDLKALRGTGLRYVSIAMNPSEVDDDEVAAFLQVVRNPDLQPVFVHCKAGSDRTGVAVAIYRVLDQQWPVEQAAQELPRFGFHEVFLPLLKYLKEMDRGRISGLAAALPPPKVIVVP